MNKFVEREVLGFITTDGTKKWCLMCESRQDFVEFFVM